MRSSFSSIFVVALLALQLVNAQVYVQRTATSPAFLWSNTKFLNVQNAQELDVINADNIRNVLLSETKDNELSQYLGSATQPELLVIFVEAHLRTEEVPLLSQAYKSESDGANLSNLKKMLEESQSSVTLPYVYSATNQLIGTTIAQQISNSLSASSKVLIGTNTARTIKGQSFTLETLKEMFQTQQQIFENGVTDLVVVYFPSHGGSSAEALARAYAQDDKYVNDLLGNIQTSYVALFISDKAENDLEFELPASSPDLARFELAQEQQQTGFSSDSTVLFPDGVIEGLLVMLPFLVILLIGICCTFSLQSDLKFDGEKPKKY